MENRRLEGVLGEYNTIEEYLRNFIARGFRRKAIESSFSNPAYEAKIHQSVREFRLEQHEDASSKLFEKVCAIQPANPSDETKRAKFIATFQEPTAQKGGSGEDLFIKELEATLRREDYVAIIGRRGGGKTSLINKWLYDKSESTIENKNGLNSLWFRIDASKIYNSHVSKITVEKYFYIHSIVVFMIYSGHISFMSYVKKNKMMVDIYNNFDINVKNEFRQLSVDLDGRFRKAKKNSDLQDLSVVVVDSLIEEEDLNKIQRYFRHISEACVKSGIGVISIIDGLDNISLSYDNGKYQTTVSSARSFISSFVLYWPGLHKRIILVSRPETIPELNFRVASTNHKSTGDAREIVFRPINIPNLDPSLILRKKAEAISNVCFSGDVSTYVSSCCPPLEQNKAMSDLDERCDTFKNLRYENDLLSEINEILSGNVKEGQAFYVSSIAKDEFFNSIFDGDIRSYLALFRRLAHGQRHYKAIGMRNPDRVEILPELFVLSGQVYKITATNPAEGKQRGDRPHNADLFPNIFWYESFIGNSRDEKWFGLCGLRILQLCGRRPMRISDMAKILNLLFDYPYEIIIECVQTFIAYGLLDVVLPDTEGGSGRFEDPFWTDGNPFGDKRAVIGTTKKGKICATLSLCYFKWIYFLALDTPILNWYSNGRVGDKFIRFYRGTSEVSYASYNFWDAVVPGASILIKHIYCYHRDEMSELNRQLETLKDIRAFKKLGIDAGLFSLPEAWPENLVSTLAGLVRKRMPDSTNRAAEESVFESLAETLLRWSEED